MRQVKPILPVLQQAHPLARGLVAAWLFFERGGSIVYDLSGNNNYGTLTNFPATPWNTDIYGSTLAFDGSDDNLAISSNASINITKFTIEALIKPDSVTGNHWII